MQKLTDKEIRLALISSLSRRPRAPRATLEEVHVCNGNAIADVVAVYKTMHCYEIKGETDSINRIVRQSEYYDQAFPLISLVTTNNHLARALAIAPAHWGVMVASNSPEKGVRFSYARAAARNPLYNPEVALLTLWRSELVEFPLENNFKAGKMNRKKIAEIIASSAPISVINERLGNALVARKDKLSTLDSLATYR